MRKLLDHLRPPGGGSILLRGSLMWTLRSSRLQGHSESFVAAGADVIYWEVNMDLGALFVVIWSRRARCLVGPGRPRAW